MWENVKSYAAGRWAEPETQAALQASVGTTFVWGLGYVGVLDPVISTHAMIVTNIGSAVVAVLPGPISSAIIKLLTASTNSSAPKPPQVKKP